jgi:hypothetical protein
MNIKSRCIEDMIYAAEKLSADISRFGSELGSDPTSTNAIFISKELRVTRVLLEIANSWSLAPDPSTG